MDAQPEHMRARGLLYGLAIGDALGRPLEFLTLAAIKERYGPAGLRDLPDPPLYTDDTQMSLAIAEALAERGDADLDPLMEAIVANFIAWKNSPENNRAPGITCMRAVGALEAGVPWYESGIPYSKGCGSAMRVAPVGYFYQHDPDRLRSVAAASGSATHTHPAAEAACLAVATLVKVALDGIHPDHYLEVLEATTAHKSDEFDNVLHRTAHTLTFANEEDAMRMIGEGWTGDEAVGLALYCVIRYPDDYVGAICRAANSEGDSDSVACITGAILGARLGIGAIPPDWVARIEKTELLASLADRLAAKKLAVSRPI
jgi:ADP-ribosylglycohydrolase